MKKILSLMAAILITTAISLPALAVEAPEEPKIVSQEKIQLEGDANTLRWKIITTYDNGVVTEGSLTAVYENGIPNPNARANSGTVTVSMRDPVESGGGSYQKLAGIIEVTGIFSYDEASNSVSCISKSTTYSPEPGWSVSNKSTTQSTTGTNPKEITVTGKGTYKYSGGSMNGSKSAWVTCDSRGDTSKAASN